MSLIMYVPCTAMQHLFNYHYLLCSIFRSKLERLVSFLSVKLKFLEEELTVADKSNITFL